MAYMSQEKKKQLAPGIKAVLKKYGMKGTISVRNYSTLVVTLKKGPLDFKTGECINTYWIHKNYDGEELNFLQELTAAMNEGNYNNSQIEFDYHDVGWYIDICVGSYNRPYVKTEV